MYKKEKEELYKNKNIKTLGNYIIQSVLSNILFLKLSIHMYIDDYSTFK